MLESGEGRPIMNLIFPIVLTFVIVSIASFFIFHQSKLVAGNFVISCLAIAAFCVFGFLASFEPSVSGSNIGFKIVYAGLFLAALAGTFCGGRRLFLPAA